MPARPALPLHLPPLSLSSPSSPIFLSLHNWIMGGGGGSIVHCFGFPWFKSSSQSGWEGTGGSQQAPLGLWRELLGFWMGWGHREAPSDGVAWNTTSQGSLTPKAEAGCSFGRLKLYNLSSFPFCECVHVNVSVCVFCVCGWVSFQRPLGSIRPACIIRP